MRRTGFVGTLSLMVVAACAGGKDLGTPSGAVSVDASAPAPGAPDTSGALIMACPTVFAPQVAVDPQAPDAAAGADAGTAGAQTLFDGAGAGGAPLTFDAGDAGGAGGTVAETPVEPIPLEFVAEASFSGNDNPAVPQAGVVRIELNQSARVEISITGGDEAWLLERGPAASFEEPIIGLMPGTEYEVNVQAFGQGNSLSAGPFTWSTPALPDDFPPIALGSADPEKMEPGMTFFNVRTGWSVYRAGLVIVDANGIVRWYYDDWDMPALEDPRLLEDGHFLFNDSPCTMREIDALGNVVGTWNAAEYPLDCEVPSDSVPVAINSFHHDLSALPDGNFLVLSNRVRDVDDYPTSEDDPDAETEPAQILECLIVEFTREGEIVKSISTGDLIDPSRIGRDSLGTSWVADYVPEGEEVYDWDHCNSVHYEASSDSYYVSLRHQDAVLKIARSDETLTWILGNPENWQAPWSDKLLSPLGDLLWPFHQHSAKPNRFGLGMYDNGNYRAAAFQTPASETYSRAVVYVIDEAERTVSQVWEYGPATGEDSHYSSAMGDADWLAETDNVLIVAAQMTSGSSAWAQVFEVSQDGSRVFELNVGEHDEEGDEWSEVQTVYRAERIRDVRQ